MPNTWYVILRLGQGFAAGVIVGVLWALWIIRQRRTSPPGPGHRPSTFRVETPDTADGRLTTG